VERHSKQIPSHNGELSGHCDGSAQVGRHRPPRQYVPAAHSEAVEHSTHQPSKHFRVAPEQFASDAHCAQPNRPQMGAHDGQLPGKQSAQVEVDGSHVL
jgi:hypothetical protein